MEKKEAIKILGLSEYAEIEEATKNYRKLVLKHHPDKGGKAEDFIKIKDA